MFYDALHRNLTRKIDEKSVAVFTPPRFKFSFEPLSFNPRLKQQSICSGAF
jgi:hypothetical protein